MNGMLNLPIMGMSSFQDNFSCGAPPCLDITTIGMFMLCLSLITDNLGNEK